MKAASPVSPLQARQASGIGAAAAADTAAEVRRAMRDEYKRDLRMMIIPVE